MQLLKMFSLGLLVVFAVLEGAFATDPKFKFLPAASLSDLLVQHVSEFQVKMEVGSNPAVSTVIAVNGPFADGHAGMTAESMSSVSKGSNVAAPDFLTAVSEMSSTGNDGLYDVIYKNLSAVSRTEPSMSTTANNLLTLKAFMKTVDKPGADIGDTLWVWASAEMGDRYVWVSEEATTIKRSVGDNADVAILAKPLTTNLGLSGSKEFFNGTLRHTSVSRINAYNVKLRFYLPPYAEYVAGSYESAFLYSNGSIDYNNLESKNELSITYPKIGITDMPDFKFALRFKGEKLDLVGRDIYKGSVHFLATYCNTSNCSPNGATRRITRVINKEFKVREDRDTFYIKHIASGRCWSYANGATNDLVTLKAACDTVFTFDNSGALKHAATSKCFNIALDLKVKMSSNCDSPLFLYMSPEKKLQRTFWRTSCLAPEGTGNEGEKIVKTLACHTDSKFKFVDALQASNRLAMARRVVLHSGGTEFFYCNRQTNFLKPSCYYKNGTYASSVKALPVNLMNIKAWDASKSELYGIGYQGKSYVKVRMSIHPLVADQVDDSTFTSAVGQEGIKLSTNLLESSLKDYPEAHLSSGFAVSLKGVYQLESSIWKLISRW